MKTFAAIVFLGALASVLQTLQASTATSGSGCLCTSDQPCWLSAGVFSQLESQLSQPLIYPLPTASLCYPPSDPSENCTDVTTNWYHAGWRAMHPGSMESINFEAYAFQNGTIDACFLNTRITGTCGQGRVPVIGVDARSVQDVQAAIGFAVEHGLKLVVKNTGHDIVGRSAARDSFMVWMHNMKNITYDAAFVLQGAPKGETYQAITVGAGAQFEEVYDVAVEHGRLIIGGASFSVGAGGGWVLGGGFSAFSPHYGLGADNALEISVVLSTGEYLTTNEYQHSDLFWAMCGGGGGTYGIMTSITFRTYPTVPVQEWIYQANVTNSSILLGLVEGFLQYQTQFVDGGWGGYANILSGEGLSFTYYAPNMTNETAMMTQQGWLNYTQSLASYGVVYASTTSYYSSWYDPFYQLLLSQVGHESGNRIGTSRLLSSTTVAADSSRIAQLLVDCGSGIYLVAGGRVEQLSANSVGLNPAWRDAIVTTYCPLTWDESASPTEVQQVIQQAKGSVQAMYDVSPNDGTYFNIASPFEVDWQRTFFGAHYSTLKSIKDKYDPYRVFVVHQGVGSEDWNEDLTCRN